MERYYLHNMESCAAKRLQNEWSLVSRETQNKQVFLSTSCIHCQANKRLVQATNPTLMRRNCNETLIWREFMDIEQIIYY